MARDVFDGAAVVKIVETEGSAAASLNGKVATSRAEIIAVHGIHVERSAALAQNQARNQRAIFE